MYKRSTVWKIKLNSTYVGFITNFKIMKKQKKVSQWHSTDNPVPFFSKLNGDLKMRSLLPLIEQL